MYDRQACPADAAGSSFADGRLRIGPLDQVERWPFKRLLGAQIAAGEVGDGQWIVIAPVSEYELALADRRLCTCGWSRASVALIFGAS
jgi:hypothetical protein